MAIKKLKINDINNDVLLVAYRHFKIFGNFNDWSTNKQNYLIKARLYLKDGNTNRFHNLFHANYWNRLNDIDILQIHVAKVYLENEEGDHQLKYKVKNADVDFNLDPDDPNAKVEIQLLVYDLDERCEDKYLHLEGIKTNTLVKPLKPYDCSEEVKKVRFKTETVLTPETSNGNILQGSGGQ
ncbi:hypothetical protein MHTCC0001_21390 [Flavobacteriaceae bacterium MHTCC 0001]